MDAAKDPHCAQRVKELFAAEQKSPSRCSKLGDLPQTYELIDASWLTAILSRGVANAEVDSFELGPTDDGTSNRRGINIVWNEAGRKAALPTAVFCKATMGLTNRLNMLYGGVDSETQFYNKLVAKLPDLRTHDCYYAHYDPQTYNSIVVLRDDSAEVNFLSARKPITKDMMKGMLSSLAYLHGTFWGLKDKDASGLLSFRQQYENYIILCNVGKPCVEGFLAGEHIYPDDLFARKDEFWPAVVKSYKNNEPLTLVHSDPHLSNWFQDKKTGQMGVQDFQSTGPGDPFRDVLYCMTTALSPEQRRDWQRELVRHYLSELAARGGPTIPEEEAWQSMKLHAFSGLAFWTTVMAPDTDMPDFQPLDLATEYCRRLGLMLYDLDAWTVLGDYP